jgi:hypothetical protein
MAMNPRERAIAARMLSQDELFNQLMDGLEAAAIDQCVHAPATDHEARAAFAAQVRAIRDLRSQLRTIIASDDAERERNSGTA